jgi:anhydro-N-acetylmuramic acid kinase
MALNHSGNTDELHQAALAANALSQWYALAVEALLAHAQLPASAITALGAHGQTVRHHPNLTSGAPTLHAGWAAYTLQLLNPALLAELTGITVVADFRSRDVAAGGQGAPLVPAFHQAMFAQAQQTIAVLNIGGMANVSLLHADGSVQGFDTGPGNVLLDCWCEHHTGQAYDADGQWAASGAVQADLLSHWLSDTYFQRLGPRSTGRDYFNLEWINQACQSLNRSVAAVDVQATLLALTTHSIRLALQAADPKLVIVCGGGVFNAQLMQELRLALAPADVHISDMHGLPAMHVEAAAFAWLAHQTLTGQAGNLVSVTGAAGPRILGAIYPA